MKANEFVKKHGVSRAKILLVESIGCGLYVDANYRVTLYLSNEPRKSDDIDFIIHRYELERLVESHEIVKKLGGFDGSREIIDSAPSDSTHIKINLGLCIYYCQSTDSEGDQAGLWIDDGVGYWGLSSYQNYELSNAENRFISIVEVRKAIADVEACQ